MSISTPIRPASDTANEAIKRAQAQADALRPIRRYLIGPLNQRLSELRNEESEQENNAEIKALQHTRRRILELTPAELRRVSSKVFPAL